MKTSPQTIIQIVPEPSQLALVALGTLLLGFPRWQKMKSKIATGLLLVGGLCFGHAQGFINLNFEQAVITTVPSSDPTAAYASNAIPGWTAYIGSNPQTTIIYNTISLGATAVSILGTNAVPSALSGSFSIELYGGLTDVDASIRQTGLVPVGANSLLFKAKPTIGTLQVSLGGQDLSYFVLTTEANYNLYVADISAFSGQTLPLTFSAPHGGNNYWNIDDIVFSPAVVPEPSQLALAALGTLLLGIRFRANTRQ